MIIAIRSTNNLNTSPPKLRKRNVLFDFPRDLRKRVTAIPKLNKLRHTARRDALKNCGVIKSRRNKTMYIRRRNTEKNAGYLMFIFNFVPLVKIQNRPDKVINSGKSSKKRKTNG